MEQTNVSLVLTINFLHCWCAGLIAPIFTYYVTLQGGNHITLGILVAGIFLCNKISKEFTELFEFSKKFAIGFCLLISSVTYLILIFTGNPWIIVFAKWIYTLTDQVSHYSKEYVAVIEPQLIQVKIFELIDITNVAGGVIGAISGGYLHGYLEFGFILTVSGGVTFLDLLLLQSLDDDHKKAPKRETSLMSHPFQFYHRVQDLNKISYRNKWDCVLLKSVCTFAFTIYFSRFAFMITHNYHVSSVIIGYSIAYLEMLKFASESVIPVMKERSTNRIRLFERSLLICGCTLAALYYAPRYEIFLIIFIPMIFTHTMVTSFLKDDILNLNYRKDLSKAVDTIDDLIHIIGPIFFGICAQIFGGESFKMLTVLPATIGVYFVSQRLRLEKDEERMNTEEFETSERTRKNVRNENEDQGGSKEKEVSREVESEVEGSEDKLKAD